MGQYFFILGREPDLSVAELGAVFARYGIRWELLGRSSEALVVMTHEAVPEGFLRNLGGCPKMGSMLESKRLSLLRETQSRRIVFGFSVYAGEGKISPSLLERAAREWYARGLRLKKQLREQGIVARLVTSRERILSSVVVTKNKLIENGREWCVFVRAHDTLLGETTAVQEFEAYSERDYGRPRRNTKRGMLPPKLAKMMVNLARIPSGGTLLDPFCGSGTILQEAALLGYRTIGSDVSEQAIEDTKENFQFLSASWRTNFQRNSTFNIQHSTFFSSDVRDLSKRLPPHSVDAIVTEPYLGPPLTGRETKEKLTAIRGEVALLFTDALIVFRTLLRSNGRVVLVMPIIGGRLLELPSLAHHGWQLITPRGALIYRRPDQRIGREIVILTQAT